MLSVDMLDTDLAFDNATCSRWPPIELPFTPYCIDMSRAVLSIESGVEGSTKYGDNRNSVGGFQLEPPLSLLQYSERIEGVLDKEGHKDAFRQSESS